MTLNLTLETELSQVGSGPSAVFTLRQGLPGQDAVAINLVGDQAYAIAEHIIAEHGMKIVKPRVRNAQSNDRPSEEPDVPADKDALGYFD